MILEFLAEIINILFDRKRYGTKGTIVLIVMMLLFMSVSIMILNRS